MLPPFPDATLTDLVRQSLYARQAQNRVENRLSRSLTELTAEVRNLHDTIQRITAPHPPESGVHGVAPLPDTSTPSRLDDNGDRRALK
ncbi:hypothetical protein [Catenuloplanes japonicus]|uniref:hypothetical protein n=1 Tax=Catenuloplanes japonicus TaxID=33876 RepID=UPI000B27ABB3|nr:hypothetical protein [Catenuloplanes japonicus]